MSIRDVEPIGWAWDYAMDGWREVYDEDIDDDEEDEADEDWRESCLTARERN